MTRIPFLQSHLDESGHLICCGVALPAPSMPDPQAGPCSRTCQRHWGSSQFHLWQAAEDVLQPRVKHEVFLAMLGVPRAACSPKRELPGPPQCHWQPTSSTPATRSSMFRSSDYDTPKVRLVVRTASHGRASLTLTGECNDKEKSMYGRSPMPGVARRDRGSQKFSPG